MAEQRPPTFRKALVFREIRAALGDGFRKPDGKNLTFFAQRSVEQEINGPDNGDGRFHGPRLTLVGRGQGGASSMSGPADVGRRNPGGALVPRRATVSRTHWNAVGPWDLKKGVGHQLCFPGSSVDGDKPVGYPNSSIGWTL